MDQIEASMNAKIRLFFTVFTILFAGFHFWVLFVLTENFSLHFIYNFTLAAFFIFGFIAIPIGYRVSQKEPRSKFYFLSWIGYIWLGFLFTSLWISTLFYILKLLINDIYLNSYHVLGLICVVCLYALFKGLNDPVVRIHKIKFDKKLDLLKIVHITDLHVGLLRHNKAWLERVVKKINALDADFVVLTGDLVEGKWSTVFPMIQSLKSVQARKGKLYVSGNHEFIHGGLLWEKTMTEMGWTSLHNEHKIFEHQGQKIMFAGVPDRMVRRFESHLRSIPDEALKTDEKVDCKILLAHEPASVLDLKSEKPDFLLSGHTHGGQIFPFQMMVRMVQPLVLGWKTIKGIKVFAHPGTGLWGPPMRLGTENQIVLLELSGSTR